MDFCLVLEIWVENIGKSTSECLSSKYGQKFLDNAKQSATEALKTASKVAIQETAEATGDLIGNKIADRITKVLTTSSKNNSETNEEKILRQIYISPKLRQKIIDDLGLNEENY